MILKKAIFLFFVALFTSGCFFPALVGRAPSAVHQPDPEAMDHFISAKILELQGDYQGTVAELERALAYDPGSATICQELANGYFALGDRQKAIHFAQRAIQLAPDWAEPHRLLFLLFQFEEKLKEAAKELEAVVKLAPGDLQAMYSLADIYLKQDNPRKALRLLKKEIRQNRGLPEIQFKLARIYAGLGKREIARAYYRQILAKMPDSENAWLGLGMSYEMEGKNRQAIRAYRNGLRRVPRSKSLKRRLGQMYLSVGRYQEAVSQFEGIRRLFPDERGILRDLLLSYDQMGDQQKLAELVKEIRHSRVSNPDFYYYMGRAFVEMEEFALAGEMFQKAATLGNYGWIGAGYAFIQAQNFPKASEVLLKAATDMPENAQIFYLMGISLEKIGIWTEAITAFRQAIDLDPQNTDFLFRLASCLEQAGLFQEAVKEFETILAIDPNHSLALNYLGYIFADEGINLEESLRLLKKAVAQQPDNGNFLDSLGWVYYRLGKLRQAEELIIKAIKLEKNSAIILDHLGEICFALGKHQEAKLHWEKSLQLDQENLEVKKKLEKVETEVKP